MELPYTAQVYVSLLVRYNRDLWPWQAAAAACVLALLVLMAPVRLPVAPRLGGRALGLVAGLVMAAGWGWVGWGFFLGPLAAVNFLAPVHGLVFVVQAAVLAAAGLLAPLPGVGPRLWPDRRQGFARWGFPDWAGAGLGLAGLAAWPLVDLVLAAGAASMRWPGLAPGPTALATVGILLLARRPSGALALIPLAWLAWNTAAAWSLGMWQDVLLSAVGVVVGAAALVVRASGGTRQADGRDPGT
jgi:hypothetical protein